MIEQNKWSKQRPDYHTFIIDGRVDPEDIGGGKFISIQTRTSAFIKFLLLDVVNPFHFQTSLLLNRLGVILKIKTVKHFCYIASRLQRSV